MTVLSRDMFTIQIATAVYFVLIDMVTMSQYLYYLIRNQGYKGKIGEMEGESRVERELRVKKNRGKREGGREREWEGGRERGGGGGGGGDKIRGRRG